MPLTALTRARTAAALSALILLAGAPAALAETDSAPAHHPADEKILETDVTSLPDTREGQSVLAVNPRNPDNLVFTSTVFPDSPGLEPVGACFVAFSFDRGRTWHRSSWPMGDRPQCGEPEVTTDADGIFYISNNQIGPDRYTTYTNHNVVSKSVDGGRTWTGPVQTPLVLGGAPKLRVDQATGKVYAVASHTAFEYPSAISVSDDQGETWSDPSTIPGPQPCVEITPDLPPSCGYPGREIAVYGGILASASQGDDGKVAFYTTRDDGKSWRTFPVTDSDGTPVLNGTGSLVPVPALGAAADPVPWVSADPTHKGRFAVMVPRDSNLEVYVTDNAGKSWTGPATIAAPDAQRPWFDFGPDGQLGVMWRTTELNVYSVVSFDHGRTFSDRLQVNRTTEPAGVNGPPGDRWSTITLDKKYAYVGWADGRNGELDAILGRVPLSAYHGGRRP
ncbi:sialidase family protein [Streptomyces sp. NPDC001980]|uniref:sialidase family protein n=1 Tax=Streptomyces sp. NPDC001980 TaxID=3157126 RepID=UPI0033325130